MLIVKMLVELLQREAGGSLALEGFEYQAL